MKLIVVSKKTKNNGMECLDFCRSSISFSFIRTDNRINKSFMCVCVWGGVVLSAKSFAKISWEQKL